MSEAGPPSLFEIGRLDLDDRRNIVAADARFADLVGIAPPDLLSRCLDDLIDPADRVGHSRYCEALCTAVDRFVLLVTLLTKDAPELAELRFAARPDGGWWVDCHPIRRDEPLHLVLMDRERLRAALRETDDGVAFIDEHGFLVDYNPRFLELMNFRSRHGVPLSEGSLHSRRLFDLCSGEAFEPAAVARTHPRPLLRRFDGSIMHQGRRLWIKLAPIMIPPRGYAGGSLVVRDLTTVDKLQRLRSDAARAAGRAEIATGVVHNAGNALNSVNVSAQLLAAMVEGAPLDRLKRLLARIDEAPIEKPLLEQYLSALADDLAKTRLSLSEELSVMRGAIEHLRSIVRVQQRFARESEQLEPCVAAQLVDDALTLVGRSLQRRGITLQREDHPQDAPVSAARHRVVSIVANLVQNACDALEDTPPDDRRLRIESRVCDRFLKIIVTDNGSGVAPEHLDKLFTYGFTTRSDGHGFGLHDGGNAARAMGGALEVYSEGRGRGATFTLSIPRGAKEVAR